MSSAKHNSNSGAESYIDVRIGQHRCCDALKGFKRKQVSPRKGHNPGGEMAYVILSISFLFTCLFIP